MYDNLKYNLKTWLDALPTWRRKEAKKELPKLTGYSWQTIYEDWAEIKLSDKKAIPEDAFEKLANFFGADHWELRNYIIE